MTSRETNILTARPSIKSVGFPLFGAIFFGSFVFLIWTSKWVVANGTDYKTGITVIKIILGIFIFFSSACIFNLLTIKTIKLTNENLIIVRPLLMFKRIVSLNNIKNITKGDYEIKSTHRSTTYKIYKGEKTIVELKSGKKIEFNSFELVDYNSLIKNLSRLINNSKSYKDNAGLITSKYQGYGWLIFIIIVTIGLVYSIIRGQL